MLASPTFSEFINTLFINDKYLSFNKDYIDINKNSDDLIKNIPDERKFYCRDGNVFRSFYEREVSFNNKINIAISSYYLYEYFHIFFGEENLMRDYTVSIGTLRGYIWENKIMVKKFEDNKIKSRFELMEIE